MLVDKLVDGAEKWRRAFLFQKLNKLFHKLLFVRRERELMRSVRFSTAMSPFNSQYIVADDLLRQLLSPAAKGL